MLPTERSLCRGLAQEWGALLCGGVLSAPDAVGSIHVKAPGWAERGTASSFWQLLAAGMSRSGIRPSAQPVRPPCICHALLRGCSSIPGLPRLWEDTSPLVPRRMLGSPPQPAAVARPPALSSPPLRLQ